MAKNSNAYLVSCISFVMAYAAFVDRFWIYFFCRGSTDYLFEKSFVVTKERLAMNTFSDIDLTK